MWCFVSRGHVGPQTTPQGVAKRSALRPVAHGTLPNRIRAAREYAGLSRAGLAAELGMSSETIGRYERGEWIEPPKKPTLQAIARATRVPEWFIFTGFEEAPE